MRPSNSSYDASANRSIERAQDLLSQYKPGEIILYEEIEQIDDMGFNDVIRPATIEEPGEGYRVKRECEPLPDEDELTAAMDQALFVQE